MASKPESPLAGFGRKGWAVEAMSAGGTI